MGPQPNRSELLYLGMVGFATWFALLSREYALAHASRSVEYVGGILWPLAIFSAIGLSFPTISTWQAASWAFLVPALIQLSQLYHVPGLEAVRGTSLGFLVFGTDFAMGDVACYAAGALVGMGVESFVLD
jgi:hypothetical protein